MINYIKPNNEELFHSMEQLNFNQIQNYIPIYNEFFMLNKTNFNAIQLKNDWILKSIDTKINEDKHTYNATIFNIKTNHVENTNIFIKEAPLIDPFKFMTGKYNKNLESIQNLPSFTYTPVDKTHKNYIIPKVLNTQNSAYVDGLFNYINGSLQKEGFIHGISFYGSYISLKQNYSLNIADDFEYLMHSSYFKKNNGLLFNIPTSNNRKSTLQITDNIELPNDIDFDDIIELPSNETDNPDEKEDELTLILNNDCGNDTKTHETTELEELDLIDQYTNNTHNTSEYSSSTSNNSENDDNENLIDPINYIQTFKPYIKKKTPKSINNDITNAVDGDYNHEDKHVDVDDDDDDDDDEESDEDEDDDDNNSWSTVDSSNNSNTQSDQYTNNSSYDSDEDSFTTDIDEYIEAIIPQFPVHLICIEKCKNTLDSLIINKKLTEDELFSCMIQILMILITYQSGFKFTHNDLHTNNIVYTETDIQYIYYIYNEQKYLVPTYGKIYKIIDFGRSIFTINNVVICSDSYQKHEDSYSQYNFGPCLQPSKKIVEPNYSFDLCRLACSMIDEFIDSYDSHTLSNMSPFTKFLLHLCLDDDGYHILYKKNREERYPNFTLYKMIARTVHLHTPYNILQLECFEKYKHFNNTLILSEEYQIIDINKLLQHIKNLEDP
jgi:hypothetical protein